MDASLKLVTFTPALRPASGLAGAKSLNATPDTAAAVQTETFSPSGIPAAPAAVPSESATPAVSTETAPASNVIATAANENGLTLNSTGALAQLDAPAPVDAGSPSVPFSRRNPDLAAIKVSPEAAAAQRMVFMNEPSEVKGYFNALMGDKSVQLATAGYSAPPAGYEESTTRFLTELGQQFNGDIGFVTSPTADKGSIDAITSTVGQRQGAPIGYVTADSYLGYVNPDNFPADIDKAAFASQPKFAFPDADIYSKATAEVSNSFLVTGGRNASVSDFKNAVLHGNQVVVLTNEDVKSPSWDPKKNRVDNASSYLNQMLSGNTEGIPMDNPFNQDVAKFIESNKAAIDKQVAFIDANEPAAAKKAWIHFIPLAAGEAGN